MDKYILIDDGEKNKVSIEDCSIDGQLLIKIKGSKNKIIFGENVSIRQLQIHINGSNNTVYIGKCTVLGGTYNLKGDKNNLKIDKFSTIVRATIEVEYGSEVSIGEDCMFSVGIMIRTGDSHSIIDLDSKQRINFPASIFIGKHVWLGYGCNIGKGAFIQNNTICGSGSFIGKRYEEGNCVLAGIPAKVIRRNVIWDRRSLGEDIPDSYLDNLKSKFLFKG